MARASESGQLSLDEWIAREGIPFSVDSAPSFNNAVDRLMASLGDEVEVLGFGETLHGGNDILSLRNRLFERLVEAHGFSAIAIESSFPRGRLVNEYVLGRGPASYDDVQDTGFSHGFGKLEANRELVEWMRQYNAGSSHRTPLQFYGVDLPSEMMGTDSPRQSLRFVLDYLASVGDAGIQERRRRIDSLLGEDSAWENPAAAMDPAQSIGLTPEATRLRIETEDLISRLHVQRPELVAKSDESRYLEALQYARVARQLLNYHAAVARESSERVAELLGIRDAMMADNLAYVASRERGQGKVLAFAHNGHLQRSKSQLQLGPGVYSWWPVGAHLKEIFGPRYAVIGSAVGVSEANGIGKPEPGTLEARLAAAPGAGLFIPTHGGWGLSPSEIASLPVRSGSTKNFSYIPLTPQSFTDFDWLAVLDSTGYDSGAWPLPG
ncbi:MAG: erythromycin esterase family protein [Chloroflexi bacterium]|nr:erythromycin esterase family protein [Chloroflexota bacterium]